MGPQVSRKTKYSSLADQAQGILRTDDADRFVDFGVEFRIVDQDVDFGSVPRGTNLPPLVEVRDPHRIGGRFDTVTQKFVGDCEEWRIWLIGEKQFDMLINPKTRHMLLFAAEGSGKTTLMGQIGWAIVILAATAGLTGCLGATAPTSARMTSLLEAMTSLAPVSTRDNPIQGAWGTLRQDAGEIACCSNHKIVFRSTKKQSAATGSPIQSYNFGLGILMDEIQDSLDAVDDGLARLRSAPGAPMIGTCTAKDSPDFRTFKSSLSEEDWTVYRIDYQDAFAVWMSHWEMLKRHLSPREWARRALALDVGPERMVYTSWKRDENLVAPPRIGAKDVTARVLARYGPNLHMLAGHDPGSIQDYSVMLRAYQVGKEKTHRWYAVDELRTKSTTSEEHAKALREHLQSKWAIQYAASDEPKVLLRCDPYGTTDAKTDRSVYLTFKKAGFDIRSAAYSNKGQGNGVVPKEAGIEMVNALLCNANGDRRLYVSCDDRNRPLCPLLVEAIELSERDLEGKAETQKKSTKGAGGDLSDPMAATRYALWLLERIRPSGITTGMTLV